MIALAMTLAGRAAILALAAIVLNLPCGAWRVRAPKRSLSWFAAIHAPIPFAFLLRRVLDLPIGFVALTLVFAIAGQALGGRLWPPRSGVAGEGGAEA